MNDEQLIAAISKRAANPDTRTDNAKVRPRELGSNATHEMIRAVELQLGFSLHPLHRRLLETVGNGGFGPGDGLIGTAEGALDIEGRSLVELRTLLWPNLNIGVVPLCEWGDGIWSCVDVETGAVLTMSEFGLLDIGRSFRSWFEEWVASENLWQQIVVLGTAEIKDPLTKEFVAVPVVSGMRGSSYIPRMR